MGSTFVFAFNAIMPIIMIVLLGYTLRKIKFIDLSFVNLLNKFVFRIGLPILLFYNVYSINSLKDIDWAVVLFAVIAILSVFTIGLIFVSVAINDPKQKGVILQSIFRSNFALVGIPLAQALGGNEALAIVSIISAFTIPLLNVLAVVSLTMFQRNEFGERISAIKVLKMIVANPLIISVLLGLIALIIRSWIPIVNGELAFSIKNDLTFVYSFLKIISQTATPLALIALGGQFEFSVVKKLAKQIIIGVTWRIILAPTLVLTAAYLLAPRIPGISSSYPALIALFATPVAVSSAIMTHEMGGDNELAGQLVVWSTICSIVTIFFAIVMLRSIGAF